MDNERAETAVCRSTVYFPLSTLSAAGRPPPPPPGYSGTFGDRRKQWTVDNEQNTAIIHYQLCTIHCDPPHPPLVAFGCIWVALRQRGDRRAGGEEKGDHEAETFCHPVTLSPSHLVTPPPLRGIRGHSGTGSKPGSGGDGEKMPAQIGLGRAKFQLLRAKFQLFRNVLGTFWTRCLA